MPRHMVALGWLLLMPAGARGGEALTTSCPGYPAHLHAARAALVRGDRVAAMSELRSAESALESCLREEAAGRSLLAVHDTSRHDG